MEHQVLETTPKTGTQQETADELMARIVASAGDSAARRVLGLKIEGGGE